MHFLNLLAVIIPGSATVVSFPTETTPENSITVLAPKLLDKRYDYIYLFAFGGSGCPSNNFQSFTLSSVRGCQAVTNRGSIAWTRTSNGLPCSLETWSGSNCQGSRAPISPNGCASLPYASLSWDCCADIWCEAE